MAELRRRTTGAALLAIAVMVSGHAMAFFPDAGDPQSAGWQVGGYAKSIVLDSKTADPAAEPYSLAVNRFRLKLTYDIPSRFQLRIEHDTELRVGSYLDTAAFRQEKNAPVRQYWNDGNTLADKPGYYLAQHLFRAYLRLSAGAADLTLGRQRIPLGTGRMWSTLDMLNPVNPLQVERNEYVGVDAGLLEYKNDALSRLSMIYAPDPARTSSRWLGQYRTNIEGADLTLSYGKYWDDRIAAVDIATQLGDAGLRGELAYVSPQNGRAYGKALLGVDYVFPNTFGITAEAYWNGQGKAERLAQFAANPQLMQVQPFGSRYAGLILSYEFTPLFKTATYFLFNLTDNGRFVSPTLTYSISDNLTVSGGAQFFSGDPESDYGRGKNLRYVQLQWFF